jgi:hypothetical protein
MCEISLPFSGGYFGRMPVTMPRGLGVVFNFTYCTKQTQENLQDIKLIR